MTWKHIFGYRMFLYVSLTPRTRTRLELMSPRVQDQRGHGAGRISATVNRTRLGVTMIIQFMY